MSKTLFKYQNNQLCYDDIQLNHLDLIRNYKTPIVLYRKKMIVERIEWLKSWNHLHRLHFAMKANDQVDILKIFLDHNCGLDVVSLGEIKKAYSAGFKPSDLIFSGVGKTKLEISTAIQDGIYQINVESISELQRIHELAMLQGRSIHIGLRLNPEIDAQTHPSIATALVDSKFGLSMNDVSTCLNIIRNSQFLIFKSISYHLGSQIMTAVPFQNALKKIKPLFLQLQSEFKTLDRLDLGGGLGIDYKNHNLQNDENSWNQLKTVYETELNDFPYQCLIEMGRFLVARSAILISEVQYIKKTETKEIVICDVGMNNLMRPSLYQAYHHILPLTQRLSQKKYMIAGPICESTDFFHQDIVTSELSEGDLIAICDVGAYGRTMASNYNLQPIAVEYFI